MGRAPLLTRPFFREDSTRVMSFCGPGKDEARNVGRAGVEMPKAHLISQFQRLIPMV